MFSITTELENLICKSLMTRDNASDFIDQIDLLRKGLGYSDSSIDLEKLRGSVYAPIFNQLMTEYVKEFTSVSQLDDLLQELRQYVVDLTVLELDMPINPSEDFQQVLFEWFWKNDFRKYLLKFTVKLDLKAGICISWSGKYINLGIQSVLSTYLMENKDGIQRILRQ